MLAYLIVFQFDGNVEQIEARAQVADVSLAGQVVGEFGEAILGEFCWHLLELRSQLEDTVENDAGCRNAAFELIQKKLLLLNLKGIFGKLKFFTCKYLLSSSSACSKMSSILL